MDFLGLNPCERGQNQDGTSCNVGNSWCLGSFINLVSVISKCWNSDSCDSKSVIIEWDIRKSLQWQLEVLSKCCCPLKFGITNEWRRERPQVVRLFKMDSIQCWFWLFEVCVCVKVRNFRSHFTSLVPYIHWLSKMIFYMIGIRRLSSLPKVVVVCVTVSVWLVLRRLIQLYHCHVCI